MATPLSQTTFESLRAIRNYFASRPHSALKKPMAVNEVKYALATTRRLLDYAAATQRWQPIYGAAKALTVRADAIMTPAEVREAGQGVETFTPAEIAAVYYHSNRQQRAWLMLGLNLCAYQSQISDLSIDDLYLDEPVPCVGMYRGKTKVYGSYDLWQPTADILQQASTNYQDDPDRNPDRLLFVREVKEQLRPLVYGGGRNRTDVIAQTWRRAVKVLPADRQLSFSSLRDTTATRIYELSERNEALQQQVLSHARRSVAKRYTGRVAMVDREAFAECNRLLAIWWTDELWPAIRDYVPEQQGEESVGERLRRLRTKAGLTQLQVAERSSISPEHLSRIETGVKVAPAETIRKIERSIRRRKPE